MQTWVGETQRSQVTIFITKVADEELFKDCGIGFKAWLTPSDLRLIPYISLIHHHIHITMN